MNRRAEGVKGAGIRQANVRCPDRYRDELIALTQTFVELDQEDFHDIADQVWRAAIDAGLARLAGLVGPDDPAWDLVDYRCRLAIMEGAVARLAAQGEPDAGEDRRREPDPFADYRLDEETVDGWTSTKKQRKAVKTICEERGIEAPGVDVVSDKTRTTQWLTQHGSSRR